MTAKDIYRNFLLQIQSIYPLSEATSITDWVFESVAKIKKADLIKNPLQLLSKTDHVQLTNCLEQLLEYKPVQYILGEAWFYNMKLKVNEHVLIPRPETEELAESIINAEKSKISPTILDIGTGSGCIAIALRKHLTASEVSAIDFSKEALAIARENAVEQKAAVNFIQLDFLNEENWETLPSFDVIVSNPPYIPANEEKELNKNVTAYEPHSALFVPNEEPLLFYKKIAAFGKDHLNYGGKIFLETHENFAQQVALHFRSLQYNYADVKRDLYGKERIVIVRN
ncbi:peptide chain release factor N(5)-glutamine methyltransferase [Ferruginibacter albus]|uniref:peptide chain release factor N(5)-glutamine methyltransferase n=1 Tax=Ferruginibacter albus TaxID=2875540 RepID=UPI001CC43062|nr:peptide chain release factor N(5)-glutamine methyltransferase [Ferruginibacter albus]UAY52448.1 peptide chain release factor N(5)-glutamine methyltransferase [Ferruginibacter albus]